MNYLQAQCLLSLFRRYVPPLGECVCTCTYLHVREHIQWRQERKQLNFPSVSRKIKDSDHVAFFLK